MDSVAAEVQTAPSQKHDAGPRTDRSGWLRRSVSSWYGIAAIGQLAFIGFILIYYGSRTLSGDWAAWDEKPLIDGYIADDVAGNLMFIGHVLLATVMTLSGLFSSPPRRGAAFPSPTACPVGCSRSPRASWRSAACG